MSDSFSESKPILFSLKTVMLNPRNKFRVWFSFAAIYTKLWLAHCKPSEMVSVHFVPRVSLVLKEQQRCEIIHSTPEAAEKAHE